MKCIAAILLFLGNLSFSRDEFAPQESYFPNFFSELIDAEMNNSDIVYVVGVGGLFYGYVYPHQSDLHFTLQTGEHLYSVLER